MGSSAEAGACAALLLAWLWLRVGNGYGVAAYFLDGAAAAPEFPVPFRLAPVPALFAFLLSFLAALMLAAAAPRAEGGTPDPADANEPVPANKSLLFHPAGPGRGKLAVSLGLLLDEPLYATQDFLPIEPQIELVSRIR